MRTSESKDELTAALAYIETHPKEWNQTVWMCSTAACIGGHAAMISPEIANIHRLSRDSVSGALLTRADGTEVFLPTWLKERYPECSSLWSGNNNLDALRAGVKAYCNDEDVSDAIYKARCDS